MLELGRRDVCLQSIFDAGHHLQYADRVAWGGPPSGCRSQRTVTYPCLSLKELTKKYLLSSRTVLDVQSRGTEEPAWGNKWILLRRDRMGMMLAMRSLLRIVWVSLKSRWLGAGVGGKGENHSMYARCCARWCWGKWNLIAGSGSMKTTRTWTTR